jgi:hypothetical protein
MQNNRFKLQTCLRSYLNLARHENNVDEKNLKTSENDEGEEEGRNSEAAPPIKCYHAVMI